MATRFSATFNAISCELNVCWVMMMIQWALVLFDELERLVRHTFVYTMESIVQCTHIYSSTERYKTTVIHILLCWMHAHVVTLSSVATAGTWRKTRNYKIKCKEINGLVTNETKRIRKLTNHLTIHLKFISIETFCKLTQPHAHILAAGCRSCLNSK